MILGAYRNNKGQFVIIEIPRMPEKVAIQIKQDLCLFVALAEFYVQHLFCEELNWIEFEWKTTFDTERINEGLSNFIDKYPAFTITFQEKSFLNIRESLLTS